ncbi:MAG: hypothetical protein AAF752_00675 [Bacteroidota bacterium]
MGQSQLLLAVLGIVIVGIATVVGINAYAENTTKSNYDQLLQSVMDITVRAQAWKQSPELLGGQAPAERVDPDSFVGFTLPAAGYTSDDVTDDGLCYVAMEGAYHVTPSADGLVVRGVSVLNQNEVIVDVEGVLDATVSVDELSTRGGIDTKGDAREVTLPSECE